MGVVSKFLLFFQVFLVRKILGPDAGQLYAMKVLKKASLKGKQCSFVFNLQLHKTQDQCKKIAYVAVHSVLNFSL